MTTNTKTADQFVKLTAKIKVPDGFTTEIGTTGWRDEKCFTLKSSEVEITFDQSGRGHTRFKIGQTWRTFDRLGVEDSFYWQPLFEGDKPPPAPDKIVSLQLEKIAERRRYYETAVSIPQIGFTVSPEGVDDLKRRLTVNGHVSFMPSGFGTGYVISTKRSPRSGRATGPLESFFGVSPLWLSTFDAD